MYLVTNLKLLFIKYSAVRYSTYRSYLLSQVSMTDLILYFFCFSCLFPYGVSHFRVTR